MNTWISFLKTASVPLASQHYSQRLVAPSPIGWAVHFVTSTVNFSVCLCFFKGIYIFCRVTPYKDFVLAWRGMYFTEKIIPHNQSDARKASVWMEWARTMNTLEFSTPKCIHNTSQFISTISVDIWHNTLKSSPVGWRLQKSHMIGTPEKGCGVFGVQLRWLK